MEEMPYGIIGTRHTINNEYEQARGNGMGSSASLIAMESLGRIENSLESLDGSIRQGKMVVTPDKVSRVRRFNDELNELRKMITSQKEDLRTNGLRGNCEDILFDVRNVYNNMVDELTREV